MSPRTIAVAVLALLLAVANLAAWWPSREAPTPTLAAVEAAAVRRIELSDSVNKVVLERDEAGGWRMLAPVAGPADAPSVDALLALFREPLPMDARVDEGDLATYGLEPGKGVVVELWAEQDAPLISLTVGAEAPGGSRFVRLSGGEAIYRARLPAGARFAVEAAAWRDRELLPFKASELLTLRLEAGGLEPLELERQPLDAERLSAWSLRPAAPWAVDQGLVDTLVGRLAGLRAEEVLAPDFIGGFDPPVVVARFGLRDGRSRQLQVGRRAHESAAFVRIEGQPAVFRVPRRAVLPLLLTREELRDRRLLRFDPSELDLLSWDEDGRTRIVRSLPAEGRFEAVEPAGAALDVERLQRLVLALAELRGERVLDEKDASFPVAIRLRLDFLDGQALRLELGRLQGEGEAAGRPIRSNLRPETMWLREQSVEQVRASFPRP